MCGRTVCMTDGHSLRRRCQYMNRMGIKTTPMWEEGTNCNKYQPSFNVAPGAHTPVLYNNQRDERILQPMLWGLLPSWFHGSAKDFSYKMNNCRSESILSTASFKKPFELGQRCVVLADGFYEWKKSTTGKQPYFIFLPKNQFKDDFKDSSVQESCETADSIGPGDLLHFAGLFDKWMSPEGELVKSYSIITVDSSPSMSTIHHRMPAVLTNSSAVDVWLSNDNPKHEILDVIKPCDTLSYYPVTPAVNNSRYNQSDCITKVEIMKPKPSASAKFMTNWLKKGDSNQDRHQTVKTEMCSTDSIKRKQLSVKEENSKILKRE